MASFIIAFIIAFVFVGILWLLLTAWVVRTWPRG